MRFAASPPLFLGPLGVFLTLLESGVVGDFKTPNLGFCFGSKGTRDDPSGLTSRLRSVFLNSAAWQGKIIKVQQLWLNWNQYNDVSWWNSLLRFYIRSQTHAAFSDRCYSCPHKKQDVHESSVAVTGLFYSQILILKSLQETFLLSPCDWLFMLHGEWWCNSQSQQSTKHPVPPPSLPAKTLHKDGQWFSNIRTVINLKKIK